MITCDEFIEVTKSASTKTVLIKSTSRKTAPAKAVPTKTLLIKVFQNFFRHFTSLFVTCRSIIYCYVIKYLVKQNIYYRIMSPKTN